MIVGAFSYELADQEDPDMWDVMHAPSGLHIGLIVRDEVGAGWSAYSSLGDDEWQTHEMPTRLAAATWLLREWMGRVSP